MNLLLFEEHELTGSLLRLPDSDRRTRHIREVLVLAPGDELRVGLLNGNMGTGRIRSDARGIIEIEVDLPTPPPPRPRIELILALPRPIMLQRILKQATVLGVHRFHLIRSRRVQKSYFQTTVLKRETMRDILVQGLEQAMDTIIPEVLIHHRFKPFVEDVVPGIDAPTRLLAHPDADATLAGLYADNRIDGNLVLAVGPEGGWVDYEVNCFLEHGFCGFSMGHRILHVDTAVLVLLSRLQMLQELSASHKHAPPTDQSSSKLI